MAENENNEKGNSEQKKLKKMAIFGLILLVIIYPLMFYVFGLSGTPSNLIVKGEVSFSGQLLKNIYWQTADLTLYKVAQGLDYVFMLSYGLLLYSLTKLVIFNLDKETKLYKMGTIFVKLAIIAPILDVFENLFIFLTLLNPLGFPDWLAIAQSSFSVPKWLFIIMDILFIIVTWILNKFKHK